jgi:hypothetical protein
MPSNLHRNLQLYALWKSKRKHLPGLDPAKHQAFEIFELMQQNWSISHALDEILDSDRDEFLGKLIKVCERNR